MTFSTIIGSGILSKLPPTEQQFLLTHANNILQQSSGTLEDLCRNVANIFQDKNYGWDEAIKENRWYRYPSEVKQQRFCSEEALKNYLLLQVLGIPVTYCLLENYKGTSMAHEVVIVQNENNHYLIDWDQVVPITIEPEAFILTNNEKINFKTMYCLPQEEVLKRVITLRNGERFLDAVECEQILFRKETPEGQLQGSVKYDQKLKILDFTFVFIRYTSGLRFYLRHSTGIDEENKTYDCQEFGLCDLKHCEISNEIPILEFDNGNVCGDINTQLHYFEYLDIGQQRSICMEAMYDSLCRDHLSINGFIAGDAERDENITFWKIALEQQDISSDAKETLQRYISIYEQLQKVNPHAAQRFLDFRISQFAFDRLFPTSLDINEKYWAQYETNPFTTGLIYLSSAMRDLGQAFSSESVLETSNILTKSLCQKIGIEFKPCNFSELFRIVNEFSTTY